MADPDEEGGAGSMTSGLRDHVARESGAAASTIIAIAGHVSRRMLERYSHVRMEAKRTAMETVATSTRMAGYDTNHDTNTLPVNARLV